jgi:hypothetical protein
MRNAVHQPEFVAKLRLLLPDFERADEFVRGVEWILCRDPHSGTEIGRTNVWFLPAADIFPQPLSIFYTFSQTEVFLLDVVSLPAVD